MAIDLSNVVWDKPSAPVAKPKANFSALEQQYGLPSGILDATYTVESSRGANVDSTAGAQGPFQLMPATAKQYGVKNAYDLNESATAAAKIYRDLSKTFGGDKQKMIAAYNWGQGNVQRHGLENAPAETRAHLQKMNTAMGGSDAPNKNIDLSNVVWDTPAPTAKPVAAPTPKPADMSWGDVGTGFAKTILPSTGKLIGQAVKGLYDMSGPAVDAYKSVKLNPVGTASDVVKFVTSPQGQQQLTTIAKTVGGDLANRYGSVEAIKKGLATDGANYLADLSLLLGGIGWGIKGAGVAGKMPMLVKIGTTSGKIGAELDPIALATRGITTGAKTAAKLLPPPVTEALSKIPRVPGRVYAATREYGSNVLDPVTNWLKKTGDKYLPELHELAKQPFAEPMPSIKSTFDERIATKQIPVLKPVAGQAELMKKGGSTEANAKLMQRKKEMATTVESVGGGEKRQVFLEKVREEGKKRDYAKVDTKTVKADEELLGILDRADKAVKKAQEIAKVDGREFVAPFDIRSAVEKAYSTGGPLSTKPYSFPSETRKVTTAIKGQKKLLTDPHTGKVTEITSPIMGEGRKTFLTDPRTGKVTEVIKPSGGATTTRVVKEAGGTYPATAVPQFSGETLSTIDKVLGEAQKGFLGESRVGKAEATAYANLQKEYRAWLDRKENLPELRVARDNFSRVSNRIQKTKIAEYLKKKVGDIHNKAGEDEYLALVADEPRLIKEATGDETYTKLSDIGFNEVDMRKINEVKAKAEQGRETKRYADLAKNEDVYVGEPWKHVSVLNIQGTLANMGMALRSEALSKRAAIELKGMLLNPENGKLAQAYSKAMAQGDKRLAADAMRKLLAKKAAKGITYPATVTAGRINALQPKEQKNKLAQ